MAAQDVGTIRTAIADRLKTLGEPLRVYDTFPEDVALPQCAIIYPQANPTGQWWITAAGTSHGALSYRFTIEVWVDTQRGVEPAQDVLDAYISPAGTHADSIENCLESRTTADNLTTYTTSVRVDQFTTYGFGSLHGHEGLLYATIPIECLVSAD